MIHALYRHPAGAQTSSDCLVRDGEALWFAHTRASDAKDAERPVYWHIGADLPEHEGWLRDWVDRNLKGYTGLCNIDSPVARTVASGRRTV